LGYNEKEFMDYGGDAMAGKSTRSSFSKYPWWVRAICIFIALLIVGSTLAALFYL
jgi:hypothetical protein